MMYKVEMNRCVECKSPVDKKSSYCSFCNYIHENRAKEPWEVNGEFDSNSKQMMLFINHPKQMRLF